MNAYTFTRNGYTFRRISKAKARAAYNNRLPVALSAVYANPAIIVPFIAKKGPCSDGDTFDALVNSFEYYNCSVPTLGRYAAYYIPVRTVDGIEEYDYSFIEGGKERA